MAVKNILFNSFNLQDDKFKTRDIIYRNLPTKTIDLELNTRRDGFRLINTSYTLKDIIVSGQLILDTEANLKTSLDLMKEALHVDEANLDIDDGSTIVRYVCSVEAIEVPEQHYHITRVPYQIVFRCQPIGHSTSQTNDSKVINQASPSPYLDTFDPVGSAPPLPILKWTINVVPSSDITQIVFENTTTGDTITIPNLVLDAFNDFLEIDIDAMTVKVSYDGGTATEIDFTGVFPRFKATNNSYKVTITGGGATWELNQDIDYFEAYL